jgi:hypothetical protein
MNRIDSAVSYSSRDVKNREVRATVPGQNDLEVNRFSGPDDRNRSKGGVRRAGLTIGVRLLLTPIVATLRTRPSGLIFDPLRPGTLNFKTVEPGPPPGSIRSANPASADKADGVVGIILSEDGKWEGSP